MMAPFRIGVLASGSGTNDKLGRLNDLSKRGTAVAANTIVGAGAIAVADGIPPSTSHDH